MLVLCVLRYLGRGWTVDDLEESTAISHETIRQFIHVFICFGSDTLYDKYVIAPFCRKRRVYDIFPFATKIHGKLLCDFDYRFSLRI